MPAVRFDAIIIGAGHNGLTAASYLARAGLKTVMLERRDIVGGCAVTEEIDPVNAPGCRVSTASYIASMLRPEVIRDLKLASYGLRMVACSPGVQTALPDGRVISWWADRKRMADELKRFAPQDVERFFAIDEELQRLAAYLQPFFLEAPPDPEAAGFRRIVEFFKVARRFRRMRGRDAAALVRFLTGSLGDFHSLLETFFPLRCRSRRRRSSSVGFSIPASLASCFRKFRQFFSDTRCTIDFIAAFASSIVESTASVLPRSTPFCRAISKTIRKPRT